MKKKLLLSLALLAGLGFTGFAKTTNAAGNISDRLFKFTFNSSGSSAYTEARPKYNSTSAYMKHDSVNDGAGGFKVAVVDKSKTSFSRTWWTPVIDEYTPRGTEYWIHNYAYEDIGYGVEIRLKGQGSGGTHTWDAVGVWSPDSVGER